ncbi:MAG: HAMP domain-containing histidine kinase [Ruminiclostridium sp.]|nr:HAMP domain-containing histidine kinase [Ruminiclostridium sp.]
MIQSLRRKFIAIMAVALAVVFVLIAGLLFLLVAVMTDRAADQLTDTISLNGGTFPTPAVPPSAPMREPGSGPPAGAFPSFGTPDMINAESSFSTRFFIVTADSAGNIESDNTDSIFSVNSDTAREYAGLVLDSGNERGWINGFRYKLSSFADKQMLIFVDGSLYLSLGRTFFLSATGVLLVILLIVFVFAVLFAGKVVKPAAESYEKQKQFITDANHELKTPLTLIMTNIEILQEETGENEWLSDIRSESERMSELVNELVALSRMDEESTPMQFSDIDLSEILSDMVSEYEHQSAARGLSITESIQKNVVCTCDESMIRHLFSILLDNAVKYCDKGGVINVRLEKKLHITLYVENTFEDAENTELDRLFDRFYRSDKARTAGSGYGIGLSLAKSIAAKHKGHLTAYRRGKSVIGFKATLK